MMTLPTTKTSNNAIVNIIVALDCEARSLIDAYRLKKRGSKPFAYYCSQDNRLQVIVSGIGAVRTAAATAYLASKQAATQAYYLNLGIAGCQDANLGELYYCHKISDAVRQSRAYPHKPKNIDCATKALVTVAIEQDAYPDKDLIDMEGAAFFQAASLWVPEGQVHVVKLVSDTKTDERNAISKAAVIQWMQAQQTAIDAIVQTLLVLSAQEVEATVQIDLSDWLETWHFSQYQQHQLNEYVRRWRQVGKGDARLMLADCRDGSAVLSQFDVLLKKQEYTWP